MSLSPTEDWHSVPRLGLGQPERGHHFNCVKFMAIRSGQVTRQGHMGQDWAAQEKCAESMTRDLQWLLWEHVKETDRQKVPASLNHTA